MVDSRPAKLKLAVVPPASDEHRVALAEFATGVTNTLRVTVPYVKADGSELFETFAKTCVLPLT